MNCISVKTMYNNSSALGEQKEKKIRRVQRAGMDEHWEQKKEIMFWRCWKYKVNLF